MTGAEKLERMRAVDAATENLREIIMRDVPRGVARRKTLERLRLVGAEAKVTIWRAR